MCDSTDVPASIYDRKMDARLFDTIHEILRCLSLAQSLLKGRNAPIWRIGNQGVNLSAANQKCPHFAYTLWSDQSQAWDFFAPHASVQSHASVQRSIALLACDWLDWIVHFGPCETPQNAWKHWIKANTHLILGSEFSYYTLIWIEYHKFFFIQGATLIPSLNSLNSTY